MCDDRLPFLRGVFRAALAAPGGARGMTVPNRTTPEGHELGRKLARLCDASLVGKPDNRCETCAFRAGDHLANGSPETLMSAMKCAMEGDPFWCHEHDRACAGWVAMRFPKGRTVAAPWINRSTASAQI